MAVRPALFRFLNISSIFCLFMLCGRGIAATVEPARVVLSGSASSFSKLQFRALGRLASSAPVTAAITLPLRNVSALESLLQKISDPNDPEYGHYLTPSQFTAQFGPTAADYAAVASYVQAQGLTVTGTHANRLLLEVQGPAQAMETIFHVQLKQYQAANGRIFHATDVAPSLPRSLARTVSGIVGLSSAFVRHPYKRERLEDQHANMAWSQPSAAPGTGPRGGLSPNDIRTAYGLSGVSLNGSGQTLALFELDGYDAADIRAYENQFGLPNVTLQNVLISGVDGSVGEASDEVTLDIELQIALASGVNKLLVYEAPNTDAGTLAGYNRIAEDNQAKQISTSWGLDEPDNTSSFLQSEKSIFMQMAAQGQTIYAASGDSGAYDTGSLSDGLTVDDPAAQPYVCGVGGTSLTTSGSGGVYSSETTWNGGSVADGGSGGGVSKTWSIPSWQQGVVSTDSGGSTTMRNVPDVSFNADPNSGYAIYVKGKWVVYGGTSTASPLWAGFTALVNQQRAAQGLGTLGQASPALYPLLAGARYAFDFHDIADGSTNLYYATVSGYDDATGLGSFNGSNLLADLAPTSQTTAAVPATPANVTATAGNAQVVLKWNASSGATGYKIYRSQTSGGGFTQVGSSATVSDTDTGLTNGTTYYYVVTATNSVGESARSNQVSSIPVASVGIKFSAGLGLISLPYDYPGTSLASVFGYSGATLAVWQPALLQYVLTPTSPADHIRLGQGYWVRFPSSVTVSQTGTLASTATSFSISLESGWNMIGDPFLSNVTIGSLKVTASSQSYSFSDAANASIISASLYSYAQGSTNYTSHGAGDALQPGLGYWIYAGQAVTLTVPPPGS